MADNTSDKTKKNLIEIVDNAILGFNKKLAMKWMKLTGESKSSLEKSLYYGSGMTIAALGIETQILPLMLPAAYMAYIGTIVSARPTIEHTMDKEDKIESQLYSLNALSNVLYYTFGVIETIAQAGVFVSGVISKNSETCKKSFNGFILGFGVLSYMSAKYLSRAEIEDSKTTKINETILKYK